MLRISVSKSISGCSKAPRGLSVLPHVAGIFTGNAISPGPSGRQCPSRYAFRAGRNLPDKEFRYHRTVTVTAAVYRCFRQRLPRQRRGSPSPLTNRHWAGVSPYTLPYGFAGTCVFGKQSLGLFRCGPPPTAGGRPYPEVTAAFLPSSFPRVIPFP